MVQVCLVIPSLQAGGMERVMSQLAEYFSTKDGIEVHLILYGISREIFYEIPREVIVHKPSFKFDNRCRLYYTVKSLLYLRKAVINIKPNSILSFGEYWNNFVLFALKGLKYPVYISERSQPDKSLGWLHDALRKFFYPGARGLILQTHKAKEIYLSRFYHKDITVIGNPIKTIDFDGRKINREKNVLMVGRLIKTKHQDKLIEMFAKVNLPDWKLVIVGYDHLKQHNLDRLKKLALTLGVEEKVIFTGKQNNIEEIYLKSSIFAFTSSSEGFPNAIGEAMSAGLPVIAFDCIAGPSEMIRDGYNGYLVPLHDYEKFETRMSQLMKNPKLRSKLGKNARKSIIGFSSGKICEAFYNFIISDSNT